MKPAIAATLALALLSSCGGQSSRNRHVEVIPEARGPISSACMQSGRNSASERRCGCVQAVADDTLSRSDQRLGASFFDDPHKAQEIRQSDSASNEAFWKRWREFGVQAEKVCAKA
ncbi:hypothetical protein [Albibacillus kandeliae]|uniref:hypothetical protein n=1 Tax=Albibacillus kandeliae TaxID=2174228 RepID=UPI000D68AD36|nr:hypothetical protein [Albibacillus kandeliae]